MPHQHHLPRRRHHHESEWIYSTIVSRRLFTPINNYVHNQPSLASTCHPIMELYVAMCGYAFNPVLFPAWPIFVYTLSRYCSSRASSFLSIETNSNNWRNKLLLSSLSLSFSSSLELLHQQQVAVKTTALYLASVVITLVATEIGKASVSTTRPQPQPTNGEEEGCWTTPQRKHEKLVSSLKSKHSFPSGDCAQAMNLCMIICYYVFTSRSSSDCSIQEKTSANATTTTTIIPLLINLLLFGIFLPSVAFARIYYRCHWIEDCLGGLLCRGYYT